MNDVNLQDSQNEGRGSAMRFVLIGRGKGIITKTLHDIGLKDFQSWIADCSMDSLTDTKLVGKVDGRRNILPEIFREGEVIFLLGEPFFNR